MRSKTLFLIDDDQDDSELFHEALGAVDNSVNCCFAADGREALHKLNHREVDLPDLIFLDINMPDMNGWQFLGKLKEMDTFKDIPVIMYSTSSQRTDINLARSYGALCFVTKPNSFSTLKKMMEVVVSHLENNLIKSVCEALNGISAKMN
jgi:CheY-like chemotaxis protein